MIHIDISEQKWKEMEEYHANYLIETVPHNLEKLKYKHGEKEIAILEMILQNQCIEIPDKNATFEEKKKKLNTLIYLCTSSECLKKADTFKKDQLFYKTYITDSEEIKQYSKAIVQLLGYENFNNGIENIKTVDGKIWNRHTFMSRVGIKVCPYCNRQYITTYLVQKDTVRTTTDTDHYFPKSEFPLLSMNIHNMVPSCQICNSRMKSNKVSSYSKRHLYPYEDLSDSLKFEIQFSNVEQLYNFGKEEIEINLKEKGETDVSDRAIRSRDIFKLKQVYEAHRDIIYNLKNDMMNYSSKEYEKIFCENYTDIFGGEENFLKVLYPFLGEDEKETPLVKLKKDVYEFLQKETFNL